MLHTCNLLCVVWYSTAVGTTRVIRPALLLQRNFNIIPFRCYFKPNMYSLEHMDMTCHKSKNTISIDLRVMTAYVKLLRGIYICMYIYIFLYCSLCNVYLGKIKCTFPREV